MPAEKQEIHTDFTDFFEAYVSVTFAAAAVRNCCPHVVVNMQSVLRGVSQALAPEGYGFKSSFGHIPIKLLHIKL